MQQFRDGVALRMCRGLTITLLFSFFSNYYLATIPKSRIRERGSVLYLGMAQECWDFAKLAIA